MKKVGWLFFLTASSCKVGNYPLTSLARILVYLSKTYGPGVSNTFKQTILLERDSKVVH
jgi:hypothetical protein